MLEFNDNVLDIVERNGHMVYFIMTVGLSSGTRHLGYYTTKSEARQSILDNWCDMFEDGYYQHAAIIEAHSGLYPDLRITEWFEYNEVQMRGVHIDTAPDYVDQASFYFFG